jgi:acetyl-CoA acetyltransferase family protein
MDGTLTGLTSGHGPGKLTGSRYMPTGRYGGFMSAAVVVDVIRTPIARRNGALAGWHPVDLVAEVLTGLQKRTAIDPAIVDDVIVGCVTQVGAQSSNLARNAVLAAGWPESVPGTTVDRQCGSSIQAVHFAAQGVLSGVYDVAVAAGVESMSVVPMFSNTTANLGDPYGARIASRYGDVETYGTRGIVPQGLSAELLAERYGLAREEIDAFALSSHERAARAIAEGRFAAETWPIPARTRSGDGTVAEGELFSTDNGVRATSLAALAKLRPAFRDGGVVTAGNSSQISDGAAAALVMSEARCAALGLTPLARLIGFAVSAGDPIEMLTAPIPATTAALARAGVPLDAVDAFEVNEAFATVPLVWAQALDIDLDRVNVNGGAIALGHPLGATGVRLLATLTHELIRRRGRYGLMTVCEAGGMANATVVENLR